MSATWLILSGFAMGIAAGILIWEMFRGDRLRNLVLDERARNRQLRLALMLADVTEPEHETAGWN